MNSIKYGKYIFASSALSILAVTSGVVKGVAFPEAGIHIEFSQIKDSFSRHLVKYIGECPGEYWSGIAEDGDLRFISLTTEPDKKLKVQLTNLRTGRQIRRDYKKEGRGSNDFTLTQLGNSDGSHEVEYAIYDHHTKAILETGTFTYNVTVSEKTRKTKANWKLELYCADDYDYKQKLNECYNLGIREVKYCWGERTGKYRHYGIVNLDRKNIEIDLDIR